MWASRLAGYYSSCLLIPSIGQIICGLSGRGLWQETRPDVYGGVIVGVVDEFAVPAVEDALREAFRVAGAAAVACPTGPAFIRGLGGYAFLRALLLDVVDHAPICPTCECLAKSHLAIALEALVLYAFRVAHRY